MKLFKRFSWFKDSYKLKKVLLETLILYLVFAAGALIFGRYLIFFGITPALVMVAIHGVVYTEVVLLRIYSVVMTMFILGTPSLFALTKDFSITYIIGCLWLYPSALFANQISRLKIIENTPSDFSIELSEEPRDPQEELISLEELARKLSLWSMARKIVGCLYMSFILGPLLIVSSAKLSCYPDIFGCPQSSGLLVASMGLCLYSIRYRNHRILTLYNTLSGCILFYFTCAVILSFIWEFCGECSTDGSMDEKCYDPICRRNSVIVFAMRLFHCFTQMFITVATSILTRRWMDD